MNNIKHNRMDKLIMENGIIGLIGLGVIGVPIAHKLYKKYKDDFIVLASGKRKERLLHGQMVVNGENFTPRVISASSEIKKHVDLLIVCVKNYDLMTALADIKNIIDENTIVLPLQNGIYSYEFFSEESPKNLILQGYVQGPNTVIQGENMNYSNPGSMHIGDRVNSVLDIAADIYSRLRLAGIEVHLEQDIKRMVWKKWMLNVAGNSVTALTGADYSCFKNNPSLISLCVNAMREFLIVAKTQKVCLEEKDIDDIINYYITYNGAKKTSMLMDVLYERRTENDYLAGRVIEIAAREQVSVPIISTLYNLIRAKEEIYLKRK